jgi:hypothetical protein
MKPMNEQSKLPPGREPLRSDWFVQQLGASQQKVMQLTVQNRALKNRLEVLEARAERVENLLMEIYLSGQLDEEHTRLVTAEMVKIDEEEKAIRDAQAVA